ncbi:MAG: LCP family protein [Lachnospiraceae bacterium]|nr:LCP family protein [Lachnospiraceae bacterium]
MANLTEEEKEILFRAHEIRERIRAEELEAGEITLEEATRQADEELDELNARKRYNSQRRYRSYEAETDEGFAPDREADLERDSYDMPERSRVSEDASYANAYDANEDADESDLSAKEVRRRRKQERKREARQNAEAERVARQIKREAAAVKPSGQRNADERKEERKTARKQKRKEKKNGLGRRMLRFLLALLLIFVILVLAAYVAVRAMITQTNYKPYETSYVRAADVASDPFVTNILLIGTDNRVANDASRSDAMILLSINRKKGKLVMTSIMRDSYVTIPGVGQNRINHAYQVGGAALLIQTIEENFKVGVDQYVQVDFYDFMEVIDAFGGVELTITPEELPYVNGYISELNHVEGKEEGYSFLNEAGTQLVNGRQALGYSRIRIIGTDFARTGRQRAVLDALIRKVKSNPLRIITACNTVLPDLTTNISDNEMAALLVSAPMYLFYSLEQVQVPINGTWWNDKMGEQDVLGIDFANNNAQLRSLIYD